METGIVSYCRIRNNKVWVNTALLKETDATADIAAFLSGLYKSQELNYPKFFKMDKLCKLGILATELLIRNTKDFDAFPKTETALLFSNNASSLDTDRIHAHAIADKQNYFPSPSVFVYTLPNILLGEIAIKYKVTGENSFFVTERFDAELMQSYCDILLNEKSASTAICGWVNVDGDSFDAFVYCVKNLNFKEESGPGPDWKQLLHTTKNIQHLYTL